jgi:hypothetical protein
MLQIVFEEHTGSDLIFALRGEVVGARARELIVRWGEYKLLRGGRTLFVDASGVTTIDRPSEAAIRYLAADGARFFVNGSTTRTIIDLVCKANLEAFRIGRRDFKAIIFYRS